MENREGPGVKKWLEARQYVRNMPAIVADDRINGFAIDVPSGEGLSCDDYLAVVTVAELANMNPEQAWKHHDSNCSCEVSSKSLESLI